VCALSVLFLTTCARSAAIIDCEGVFIADSKAVCDALLGEHVAITSNIHPPTRTADPKLHAGGQAAMYGMAAAMPDSMKELMIGEITTTYLDIMTGNQLSPNK
jgi:hypothetical protein